MNPIQNNPGLEIDTEDISEPLSPINPETELMLLKSYNNIVRQVFSKKDFMPAFEEDLFTEHAAASEEEGSSGTIIEATKDPEKTAALKSPTDLSPPDIVTHKGARVSPSAATPVLIKHDETSAAVSHTVKSPLSTTQSRKQPRASAVAENKGTQAAPPEQKDQADQADQAATAPQQTQVAGTSTASTVAGGTSGDQPPPSPPHSAGTSKECGDEVAKPSKKKQKTKHTKAPAQEAAEPPATVEAQTAATAPEETPRDSYYSTMIDAEYTDQRFQECMNLDTMYREHIQESLSIPSTSSQDIERSNANTNFDTKELLILSQLKNHFLKLEKDKNTRDAIPIIYALMAYLTLIYGNGQSNTIQRMSIRRHALLMNTMVAIFNSVFNNPDVIWKESAFTINIKATFFTLLCMLNNELNFKIFSYGVYYMGYNEMEMAHSVSAKMHNSLIDLVIQDGDKFLAHTLKQVILNTQEDYQNFGLLEFKNSIMSLLVSLNWNFNIFQIICLVLQNSHIKLPTTDKQRQSLKEIHAYIDATKQRIANLELRSAKAKVDCTIEKEIMCENFREFLKYQVNNLVKNCSPAIRPTRASLKAVGIPRHDLDNALLTFNFTCSDNSALRVEGVLPGRSLIDTTSERSRALNAMAIGRWSSRCNNVKLLERLIDLFNRMLEDIDAQIY